MKKGSGRKSTSARGDTYLQLDRISGSNDPEVQSYYDKVYREEFGKYKIWLAMHTSPDGRSLNASRAEADKEFMAAMHRVHARAGYRFIHLLSPVMQKRLREVYPRPPFEGGSPNHAALGVAV
jgi:hypothetical protein